VIIELRVPDERLRGQKAVDPAPVLSSVLQTARDSAAGLSRMRVVCDWIQYKQNFRDPVGVRLIEPWAVDAARASRNGGSDTAQTRLEVAIDLRRAGEDVGSQLEGALADAETARNRVALEPWVPGSRSLIWGFNALYWKALSLWEQATGRGYEQALPGGESDARNVAAARELILQLFSVWDTLAERRALPDELYVLELGVGNGNQARVWLDEFRRLDHEMGREYYRRLHYLMGDYSPHVLQLARKAVAHHAEHTSGLVLDATRPTETPKRLASCVTRRSSSTSPTSTTTCRPTRSHASKATSIKFSSARYLAAPTPSELPAPTALSPMTCPISLRGCCGSAPSSWPTRSPIGSRR
jgi:hypothetical protein